VHFDIYTVCLALYAKIDDFSVQLMTWRAALFLPYGADYTSVLLLLAYC